MNKIKQAIILFCLLLVVYSFLRIAFYFACSSALPGNIPWLKVLYWGLRIDFTAIFYINIIFLLYFFFIADFIKQKLSRIIGIALFLGLNIPLLALNVIDLGYFKFTGRRSNINLIYVISDSFSAVPGFIKKYWYLFLLFALLVVFLCKAVLKIIRVPKPGKKPKNLLNYYFSLFLFLLVSGGIAHGIGEKFITPATPLLNFSPEYEPLVNNSSITFLYSIVKKQRPLKVKTYYSASALDTSFSIYRKYDHNQSFTHKNVVIFILESFCKEFLTDGNKFRANTPFLDSIIARSTWCSNAFANGVMSNQGIVAILGSQPAFLDEPYYYSIYSNDKIRGIGTILKEEGYSTHFFMGAGPDHFGFGKFCKMIGIDQYHSGEDFGDDSYYDGHWGICDHKFLPFAANILNKEKSPFLSVIFNLSSHDPFTIVPEMRSRFDYFGQAPFQKAVSYVDYSLRLFFDSIKNSSWYNNTIFVFSADHSILSAIVNSYKSANSYTAYRIPIFIFDPSDPVYHAVTKPVQQLDIVPTILDKLQYSQPFMAFGRSINDSNDNYIINRGRGTMQVMDSEFLFGYSEDLERPEYLFRPHTDSTLTNNLLNNSSYYSRQNKLEGHLKAVIQRYNNSLISNSLYIK
jgi:phosphoglycerol transferase MdoB-like AlkP superfamily enzyme